MQEEKQGEYLLTAMQHPNAIPSCCTHSQYYYKATLSTELCRGKFIPHAHIPLKIILFSWLEHCPFYPFFTASPNSIWLPFHCCLSVTIIILLIAPSTADVVTATSYVTELIGLAVTKKTSSLFENSWTSIAKSVLTPVKAAFHVLW